MFWILYFVIGAGVAMFVARKIVGDTPKIEAYDEFMIGLCFFVVVFVWPLVAFAIVFVYFGKLLVRLVEGDG